MKFKLIEEQDTIGNELSPEQEKFFANSKIRNDFGDLYVCYRGTADDAYNNGFLGDIKWFTLNKAYASKFNKQVYPAYLKCSKIFDCGNTDGRLFNLNPTKHEFSEEFKALLKRLNVTEEVFTKMFKPVLVDEEAYKLRIFSIVRTAKFKDLVKRSGYDCIRTVEEQDNICFGVFNDNSIKFINNLNPTNSSNPAE